MDGYYLSLSIADLSIFVIFPALKTSNTNRIFQLLCWASSNAAHTDFD